MEGIRVLWWGLVLRSLSAVSNARNPTVLVRAARPLVNATIGVDGNTIIKDGKLNF